MKKAKVVRTKQARFYVLNNRSNMSESKKKRARARVKYVDKVPLGSCLKAMNGIVRRMSVVYGVKEMFSSGIVWTQPVDNMRAYGCLRRDPADVQRTNHFPGLRRLSYKSDFAEIFNHEQRAKKKRIAFVPITYRLPAELAEFKDVFTGDAIYILKPSTGLQGDDIVLVDQWASVLRAVYPNGKGQAEGVPMSMVAQEYINNPKLLGGFKFDFRVYVLLDSIAPLKVHVFHDGLTRICTEKYVPACSSNLADTCVHLTNYAVNKLNPNFKASGGVKENDYESFPFDPPITARKIFEYEAEPIEKEEHTGNKRRISTTLRQLHAQGGSSEPLSEYMARFWLDVDKVVHETFVLMEPHLVQAYDKCFPEERERGPGARGKSFHFVGFDIMMDEKDQLHLLEINQNASFHVAESMLDSRIKRGAFGRGLEILKAIQPRGEYNYTDYSCIEGDDFASRSIVTGQME